MGPFASRLWGFSLVRFAPARSCQDSPRPSAVPASAAAETGLGIQVPSLLPLLTLEGNFLPGLPVLLVVVLLGPQAAAGPGLCRRPASHAASQLVVEQECISQKLCLISPGGCWCLKPSTQIFIWLAVRVSKMPANLRNVFPF